MELVKQAMSKRSDRDLELWRTWSTTRKPEDFQKLKSNFRGLIRSQVNQFAGRVEIPPPAIQGEFNRQFVKAVESYDPNRGAQLSTWVTHNLRNGFSWVSQNQNAVRMTEKRVWNIGKYNNAKAQLYSELGRDPTTDEMAERLTWHPREAARMEMQLRQDLIGSEMQVDPLQYKPSKEKEVLRFLPYELDDREKFVFEHTTGSNGKPKLAGKDIAKKLGVSDATVSRIRHRVATKAKSLMEDEDW